MKSYWATPLHGYAQYERLKGFQQDTTHRALTICPEQLQFKLQLPQGPCTPSQHAGCPAERRWSTPACPVWFASQGEDAGANQPHQPCTCSLLSPCCILSAEPGCQDTCVDNNMASLLSKKQREEYLSCSTATNFNTGLGENFSQVIRLGAASGPREGKWHPLFFGLCLKYLFHYLTLILLDK